MPAPLPSQLDGHRVAEHRRDRLVAERGHVARRGRARGAAHAGPSQERGARIGRGGERDHGVRVRQPACTWIAAPPHAIRAPVIVPPAAGVTVREAIFPRTRLGAVESIAIDVRGRSPATRPVEVHCQNVHPCPPQSPAGTSSATDTPQCAIHSGYPWSANHGVSPRFVARSSGSCRSSAHAGPAVHPCTHCAPSPAAAATVSPLCSSMSKPEARHRRRSARCRRSGRPRPSHRPAAMPTFARWYAPTTSPFADASARYSCVPGIDVGRRRGVADRRPHDHEPRPASRPTAAQSTSPCHMRDVDPRHPSPRRARASAGTAMTTSRQRDHSEPTAQTPHAARDVVRPPPLSRM